ncbi:MAG: LysM peptidoglycan-binding domain-containing protein [Desulfobacteraceae bacterium]|nr:LysM peptidoglycan-binding domain-containing protein [Desulfobacteraceae bacterium]MBC2719796.1 LysM peptidoglycan-binding domain-containing protein [Desulfobacteraceae bacterium]
MPKYTVKQGDCVSSIAQKHGHFWEKIWDHPKNAQLNEKRKDPNILYPGDVVFVPDKEELEEACATEQRHRFRRKGMPAHVRFALVDDEGQPRIDEVYIIEIDGKLFSGTTDSEGHLECSIQPNAKKGKLIFEIEIEATKQKEKHEFRLQLGFLDPIDTVEGVQARLRNLGFYFGEINGKFDLKIIKAIRGFQRKHELDDTKEIEIKEGSTIICLDSDTSDQLVESHGS